MANVIEFSIKGTVTSAVSAMKKVSSSIASMGKALVNATKWAAASAGALVGFVAVVNNGIDKVAKFSSRLGVSVEQMSKMQFVASQAGVSNEQFNMATQRMTRRVAEASQGLGEAKGALIELGIESKSFQKLSLDKQFEQLADSLNKVEDPAQRLRLAFKLFDSEGTAVLQMLNGGSAAMKALAADATFLGLVISDRAAANAEKLSDAMGRATGSVKGLSRGIAGELTPVMTGISNSFANLVARNRDGIVKFVSDAIKSFFTFGYVIAQVFTQIKKIFTTQEGFSAFLDNLGRFVQASFSLFQTWAKMVAMVFVETFKGAGKIVMGFGTWLGESIANWASDRELEDFSDRMAANISGVMAAAAAKLTEELALPLDEFALKAEETSLIAAEMFGINMDLAREKAEAAIFSIAEFGTAVVKTLKTTGKQASALMTSMKKEGEVWIKTLTEKTTTFSKTFFTLMTSVIDNISQGIAKSITEGGSMLKVFQNIGKMVLNQLIAMFVKLGIQTLVAAALDKTAKVSSAKSAVGMAVANGTASWAAAPWPINMGAPAFGSAMGAAASIGVGIAGVAHGGMDNVPSESTYLLQKGERVLSPNQNKDFTSFIGDNNSGGGSGGVTIDNITIHVFENATNADAILELDRNQMEELVAGPIIDALNSLDSQGIKPNFATRSDA